MVDLPPEILDKLADGIAKRLVARLGPQVPPSKMTSKQAAEFLNVEEQTLRDWRHRGKGPAYLRVGGAIRYSRNDLERWLAGRTKGGGRD